MKERPILFSAPMVRAILDGSKTQTRRLVKPQPPANCHQVETWHHPDARPRFFTWTTAGEISDQWEPIPCPYGQPGDRLWVRENGWERPERTPKMMREGADTWEPYYFDADGLTEQESADFKAWGFKRRPSIHMPRHASRITLEITGVRVERLQDISVRDCIAEGIARGGPENPDGIEKREYRELWESINGPGSWDANPWVWVVEFRKMEAGSK